MRTNKIYPLFLILIVCSYSQTQIIIGPGLAGQELWDFVYTNYKTTSTLGYTNARDTLYSVIDTHDDSLLTCVYSGFTIALNPSLDPSTDAYNKGINCEHTWPQSMGADVEPQKSDMHHLYPCKDNVNSSRGNDPYAEIPDSDTDKWFRLDYYQTTMPTEYIDEYAEKENDTPQSFEPREVHKGDAARAMFYFYAIYRDVADTNFWNVQKDVLLQWHYADPVDLWEYNRSNQIASYQQDIPNPFVLDSTLAERIWFNHDSVNVTWHISTTGSDGTGDGSASSPFLTIQHGIDMSIDGDTILVEPGMYNQTINFSGKNIIVGSLVLTTNDTTYISQTILNGNNNGSVVTFESGEDSTTVLCGFKIIGGAGKLFNNYLDGYNDYFGGGIFINNSNPSLSHLLIIGNTANHNGGGIFCIDAAPKLNEIVIQNNTSDYGGGIGCHESNPALNKVYIVGNSANENAGGMDISFGSTAATDSVFIIDNTANKGGGLAIFGTSQFLKNVFIENNDANYGGGIWIQYSWAYLDNVSIINNNSSLQGGGIYCLSSALEFDPENRSDIFYNAANTGTDLYSDDSPLIEVIADTFTVNSPTQYYAFPIGNYSFEILNWKRELYNGNLYVNPAGDDSNSGQTSDYPLKTVSFALSCIFADSLNPNIIFLSEGTYSLSTTGENFPLKLLNYLSLEGQSEEGVILDGEYSNRILQLNDNRDITLSNLTITGGSNSNDGGGVQCKYSNLSMINTTIIDNSSSQSGGGLHFDGSTAYLENVNILQNSAERGGGGISIHNSDLTFNNGTIDNNTADLVGGGVYVTGSNPILTNLLIANNQASFGGGLCSDLSSEPVLESVTITNNSAGSDGGAIYCGFYSGSVITNSILWNNSPIEIGMMQDGGSDSISIAYSDIQGGSDNISISNEDTILWLQGNIDIDPIFCNPDSSNFFLATNSPCIDAGENGLNMGALGIGCDALTTHDDVNLPVEFALWQNYPNPFNPITTIHYNLPKRSDVQITIYDLMGREVIMLVSDTQDAGYKSAQWDATGISSGMYFYQIRAGEFVETRKMVVLK